jgi:phage gp36-like protein
MFLNPSELESGIYGHVIDEIVQDDRDIVQQAIDAAVEEVKSYLAVRYDAAKVFGTAGAERNALALENVKIIAIWNLIKLSSAEMLYDVWRERYDRVVDGLKLVAAGRTAPDLPLLRTERGDVLSAVRSGSHEKFNHYY